MSCCNRATTHFFYYLKYNEAYFNGDKIIDSTLSGKAEDSSLLNDLVSIAG